MPSLWMISWREYEIAVDKLAAQIPKGKYEYVYGIPRGGLLPAVMLSHRLGLPLFDEQILSYETNTLIVDVIVDTGKTMKEYCEWDIAVVYKRYNCPLEPTYVGEVFERDSWLVFPYEVAAKEDERAKEAQSRNCVEAN